MAKEVAAFIKLQIKGGAANPSPPVGPALGSKGVNIMDFCKQFNARTQDKAGKVLPVIITVYSDKSFEFVVKQPPVAIQLKEAAKVQKGSAAQPRQGRSGDVGSGPRDRSGQDGRHELLHAGVGYAHGCRYCTQYGYQCRR